MFAFKPIHNGKIILNNVGLRQDIFFIKLDLNLVTNCVFNFETKSKITLLSLMCVCSIRFDITRLHCFVFSCQARGFVAKVF